MFARSHRIDLLLSALFVVTAGACSGTSGCGACTASAPLPGGALPAGQTIEGGAQVRVTPQGFTKMTSILPGVLNSSFASGFNIPGGTAIGFVDYCGGGGGNCHINVGLNSVTTDVTNAQQLHVAIDAHGSTSVPIDYGIGTCTMTISVDHLLADADLNLGIDDTTGELTLHLAQINQFSFNGSHFNGCSVVSDIADVVVDILNSAVGQFVIELLTPVLDNLVQGLLPHPLGIAGMMDVGALEAGISPGTTAEMEARIVPGGYVSLTHNGMSLGVITGLNSDQDPTTRQPGLDSEPALCVPPIPAPDFSQPPSSLPRSTRNTFTLAPADEFAGTADPDADIAMGISKTTLNLAGHHAVTSGAMCLGIGTSLIPQLNVGTIGILVPSLSALDPTGKAPLLLVTRPQRELTFDIGDDAATDAITIHISHLEVDFYAFIYERYTRAFTMDLTLDAQIGMTFETDAMTGNTVLKPVLGGLDPSQVTITVLNSEFVKESPQQLEAVLPSVFGLVTQMLGTLPDINVPSFAGFALTNPTISKVTTSQDTFLALNASLGASSSFHLLAAHDPFAAKAVDFIDGPAQPAAVPSTGKARLVSVATPKPELVIGALSHDVHGAMPTVQIDADATDAQGRPLEWSYNLNGGLYHPFQRGGLLTIADQAFAWQGKYDLGLKSRVVGDWKTTAYAAPLHVIIDSVAPTADDDKVGMDQGDVTIPVHDIVSEGHVSYAFGRVSGKAPVTAWQTGDLARIDEGHARALDEDGEVLLYTRDEAGNASTHVFLLPFHGQAGESGCSSCAAGGSPGSGGLLLIGLCAAVLLVPRRRQLGLWAGGLRRTRGGRAALAGASWLGLSALLSAAPGCSCHKTEGEQTTVCEMASDCPACPANQLPFCIDNACVCDDDIPAGRVGPYSAVAAAPDGTAWVSAYAESHGDLVVTQVTGTGRIDDTAWEWVDGVPNEPPSVMGSMIRGGISGDGPDVGMYTSIAVAPDGTPMVTYFDVDNASLKFAAKVNGAWQIHTVDAGNGSVDDTGGSQVGMYTSITLRGDDGRPGVAYLAHVNDGSGVHAEVRFAASQVPVPTSQSDWQFWTVDTGDVPDGSGDPYPLPGGLGLFVDASRDPNTQVPVVAYYDRAIGALKMSKLDPNSGQFTAAVVLAGTADDAGWSPSVAVDGSGVTHVAYVDATKDDLDVVTDQANATPLVIDDGYRVVGQTVDGLTKPTFDFVGDDAKLILTPASGSYVAYQDATTQELLLAHQQQDGTWTHVSIAGATDPWPGAYGFFASAALGGNDIIMSSWVIDQPNGENWVEVFRKPLGIE